MMRSTQLLILAILVIGLSGCEEPSEVRQYRIPKSKSDLGDMGEQQTATQREKSRMVVAIAEREKATWFFKITGPVNAVGDVEDQWREILTTMSFDDSEKPIWKLAAGWSPGPPRQMRYATLVFNVPEKGKVEMAISSLDPNQDLLLNTNRWRNQLSLPPVTGEQLNLTPLQSEGGDFLLFDEIGTLGSSMMPLPATGPRLVYDVPSGWTKGQTSQIVRIRLHKGDPETSPQISVTRLPAETNKWIPNAQRWAGQIAMNMDEEFLSEQTSETTVAQISGQKIRLIPKDKSQELAIVGVMIVRKDLAWFFKLIGDHQSVLESESDFEQFLDSFQFK